MTTNIKRLHRHPQLIGVAFWSIAHLLANGDNRSLLLFGGLGAWAVVEMVSINQRQGEWQKPDKVPLTNDIVTVVVGVALFAVLLFAHPYLTGIPALLAALRHRAPLVYEMRDPWLQVAVERGAEQPRSN